MPRNPSVPLTLLGLGIAASACLIYETGGHRPGHPDDGGDGDHEYVDDDATPDDDTPGDDDATPGDDDTTPGDDDTAPVGSGPVIDEVYPDCDAVSLGAAGGLTFSATLSDPDLDPLAFGWTIDGVLVANGVATPGAGDVVLTVYEGALGEDGMGLLALSATDPAGESVSRVWTVYRSDVYPRDAYCPDVDPPPGDDDTGGDDDDATPDDTADDDTDGGDDDSAAGRP